MESLKWIPMTFLVFFAPIVLTRIGNNLKNKDLDNVGKDDAVGNVLISLSTALAALDGNNENAFRKALTVARDTIDGYLKPNA